MREIGSEFWNLPTIAGDNDFFPESTGWFLSGRSALKAIIAENRFKTAALPSWCCESIIKPFVDAGIEVLFYPVIGTAQDLSGVYADVLLLMDYFGYRGYSQVPKGFHGVVIRDLTHSIFCGEYDDADYYFGSLRKWAGFWTGGFAFGLDTGPSYGVDNHGYTALRESAMHEKARYIEGAISDKAYLKSFKASEQLLDDETNILPAADRDIEAAKHFDWQTIKKKRRENAQVLLDAFSDISVFPSLHENDCPLFVPIIVPDGRRDKLRKYLISQRIYCPVHWPISVFHRLNPEERFIYENELSIVCDQRYLPSDMKRIIEAINSFFRVEVK